MYVRLFAMPVASSSLADTEMFFAIESAIARALSKLSPFVGVCFVGKSPGIPGRLPVTARRTTTATATMTSVKLRRRWDGARCEGGSHGADAMGPPSSNADPGGGEATAINP